MGILCNNQHTGAHMAKQIEQFLSEYVTTSVWALYEQKTMPDKFLGSDIFVISNNDIFQKMRCRLPKTKKAFVAERAVNVENIHRISELPPAEKVLVIATTMETAQRNISLLHKLGLNHINFTPYCPGCLTDITGYSVAIVTGLAFLVPNDIGTIIDLGSNGIDISGFSEILSELGIPGSTLDSISNYYTKNIIKNIVKLNDAAIKNSTVKQNMVDILNVMRDGILAFNSEQKVIFVNMAAKKIFREENKELLQKDLKSLLPHSELLLSKIEDTEKLITINNETYLAKCFAIEADFTESAKGIVTLLHVDKVREMAVAVRRELKKSGNRAYYKFGDIIGLSEEFLEVAEAAKRFANTNLNILIEGESGVGKELFAQAIHNNSPRAGGAFVAANFAAIPNSLAESELFGYEEGAFTGAKKSGKRGLFEEAHLGTIFLDEIGSTSQEVQNRLLRVIEEKEIRRVGGNTVIPVNVRVIAATNVPLYELVQKGLFRLDLFFRLCAVPVIIPPLRRRQKDILLLLENFAWNNYGRHFKMSPALEAFVKNYKWPGNVRELNNLVHYLYNLKSKNDFFDIEELPKYMKETAPVLEKAPPSPEEAEISELFANSGGKIVNILQELHEAKLLNTNIGRYTLLRNLKNRGSQISEYRLKYYLKLLNQYGFINIKSTKQGTVLTPIGVNLLRRLTGN